MKFLPSFLLNCGEIPKPTLKTNSQQCALLQPLCHHLCVCTSLHISVWVRDSGIQRLSFSQGTLQTLFVLLKNKAKEVYEWLQDLKIVFQPWYAVWKHVLLFNGVNQISANGKKGQTPQKLTKQEEQDDWAFRLKLPGASELLWLVMEVTVSIIWPSDQMSAT